MRKIFGLILLIVFAGCDLDCLDKKTGLHKSSENIENSKSNKVFQFEMLCDKKKIQLNDSETLKIYNAWVENDWMYECINDAAIVKRDSTLQFVINACYTGGNLDYYLSEIVIHRDLVL